MPVRLRHESKYIPPLGFMKAAQVFILQIFVRAKDSLDQNVTTVGFDREMDYDYLTYRIKIIHASGATWSRVSIVCALVHSTLNQFRSYTKKKVVSLRILPRIKLF